MARQTPIRGSLTSMAAIARHADIVVLTNVGPDHQAARAAQLSALGLDAPVIGSRGGKGEPVRRLLDERQPSVAIFIDDLAGHHHRSEEHTSELKSLISSSFAVLCSKTQKTKTRRSILYATAFDHRKTQSSEIILIDT